MLKKKSVSSLFLMGLTVVFFLPLNTWADSYGYGIPSVNQEYMPVYAGPPPAFDIGLPVENNNFSAAERINPYIRYRPVTPPPATIPVPTNIIFPETVNTNDVVITWDPPAGLDGKVLEVYGPYLYVEIQWVKLDTPLTEPEPALAEDDFNNAIQEISSTESINLHVEEEGYYAFRMRRHLDIEGQALDKESAFSPAQIIKIDLPEPALPAPGLSDATIIEENSYALSWEKTDGAKAYNLQAARSEEPFEENIVKEIIGLDGQTLNYPIHEDAGVYYWRISNINIDDVASPWSNVVKITIHPADLADFTATGGYDEEAEELFINTSWTATAPGTTYEVVCVEGENQQELKDLLAANTETFIEGSRATEAASIKIPVATQGHYSVAVRKWKNNVSSRGLIKTIKVEKPVEPVEPLPGPADVKIDYPQDGGAAYTLGWDAVAGAQGYVVWESTDPLFPDGDTTREYEATTNSLEITGKEFGKTYFYKVSAVGENGQLSAASEPVSIQVKPPRPSPETTVTFSYDENNELVIRLDIPDDQPAPQYEIEIRGDSLPNPITYPLSTQDNPAAEQAKDIKAKVIKLAIEDLSPGTYQIRLRALIGTVASDWTDWQDVEVKAPPENENGGGGTPGGGGPGGGCFVHEIVRDSYWDY